MVHRFILSAGLETFAIGVPETVALAAVAVIGYLFGHRTRRTASDPITEQSRRELERATAIARELEGIVGSIRKDLASHRNSVMQFKSKVSEISRDEANGSWTDLCDEAEKILSPTLKLATQIAHAYDQIRCQSTRLMTFTEVRTDPLTGVSNRRALDDQLDVMFSMMNRYDRPFTICIFDIDHFKKLNDQEGHLFGDQALQKVAKLLDQSVRETDVVARYGGEEFVVVMPQTGVTGACVFAERMRQMVEEEMSLTISGGVAEAVHGDTVQSLLSRADSALYSAKADGRNCLFQHTGSAIRPFRPDRPRWVSNNKNVWNELAADDALPRHDPPSDDTAPEEIAAVAVADS